MKLILLDLPERKQTAWPKDSFVMKGLNGEIAPPEGGAISKTRFD